MTIAIERLLAMPDLGLRMVVEGVTRSIDWAHVSELTDPTPWLSGRELLLTTGLQIADDADFCLTYCRHLCKAHVAALGLSVGPGITHETLPQHLVEAAEATGLTLLEVPFRTPLEAIVRAVARMLELDRTDQLRRAIKAQGTLTASAVKPGGLNGVLHALSAVTGMWAVVSGRWGTVLASTVPDGAARVAKMQKQIEASGLPTLAAAASIVDGDARVSILPLGVDGAILGVLTVGKENSLDSFDRILLSSAVSLLSLKLEHRRRAEQATWRHGAQLLDWLIRGPVRPRDVQERLRRHDIQAREATGVVIDPVGQRPAALKDLLALELVPDVRALLIGEHEGLVRAVVLDPAPDIEMRLARLTEGTHVGVGHRMPIHLASLSLRHATRAMAVARARGEHIVTLASLRSFQAIVELGDPVVLRAVADAVLTPLDAYDAGLDEPILVPTLREYLSGPGTAEAAAEALGVHRHTLRQRLQRIGEVSGLDLHSSNDRFELWLATRIRDLLGE